MNDLKKELLVALALVILGIASVAHTICLSVILYRLDKVETAVHSFQK